MTNKIEKLTPEQEARLPEFRDKWLAHGLSTQPANRPMAEEGIRKAYLAGGLTPPDTIVWAESPVAALKEIAKAEFAEQGKTKYTDKELWNQAKQYIQSACFGQHEAAWLAFYDFMSYLGVSGPEKLEGLMLIAQSAGWWWAFEGIAFVSERPNFMARDAENRLHFETGPALSFPDGWSIWAWHGTRVPQWVIEDPSIKNINKEQNVEIRRCAIENLGWDRYVELAGLKLSEPMDDPGNPGQQLQLSQPMDIFGSRRDQLVRVLVCRNGTLERNGERRQFGLTVPAELTDPVQAAAWSYGWNVDTYKKLQRRT